MAKLITSDIISNIKKEYQKDKIKYLQDPRTIATIGLASATNIFDIISSNHFYGIPQVLLIASLISLGFNYYKNYESYERKCELSFAQQIKELPEYQEYIKKYNRFISKIRDYLNYLNIQNPDEICYYCYNLLKNGYFSYNHTYNHQLYGYYAPCSYTQLGGMVCTGASVCRHAALLFNDILNNTTATVTPLKVMAIEEKEIKRKKHIPKVKCNHLIIGIKTADEKYAFDPSCGSYASMDLNDSYISPSSQNTIKSTNSNDHYILTDKQDDLILGQINGEEFIKGEFTPIDKKDLIEMKRMIMALYKEKSMDNEEFFEYASPEICDVAHYQMILSPQRAGKEFKW